MEVKAIKKLSIRKTETYVAIGPATFNEEGALVASRNLTVPRPNVVAYAGLNIKRKAYRRAILIGILVGLLVLLLVVGLVLYTMSDRFKTKSFDENAFALKFGEGNSFSVVDKDALLAAIDKGEDLSEFPHAEIIYNAKPGLIGYRLEIEDENIAMVAQGKLFGLAIGSTTVSVYSQEGTLLTTRNIVIK